LLILTSVVGYTPSLISHKASLESIRGLHGQLIQLIEQESVALVAEREALEAKKAYWAKAARKLVGHQIYLTF
jgi:hypothetical protein